MSLLFAGTAIIGVLYGTRTWMPELASRHGAGIDAMLHYLLVTVGALFLVGYLALAYFIWRGSRRDAIGPRLAQRRDRADPVGRARPRHGASIAEGGVLAIGMPVWAEYFDAAPPADAIDGRGDRAAVHVERPLPGA